MLTERDRQGSGKATPALALVIKFTPTGEGATVAEVQLPGLSAEDADFYPQLAERYLDRIAAAFAGAEPGDLAGNRVRDLTSDASLRPGQLHATRRPRSGAETRRAKTHDVAEIGLSLVIDGGIRLVAEDGPDKIVLVREVAARPRSAHVRRGLDVFESDASHAALMD